MSKSYLKQLLTYINRVYDIGEKINTLKDKRIKSPVKISTITFCVLFSFMLQIRSFNRLEHWIEKNKFKKVLPKNTKMLRIDAVRRCLDNFDFDGLKNISKDIIKTTIKNKVFRNGT
ncbi:hypothetical protein J2Z42_000786, partial [Clostridium algifaecis]|nr:hypothetical protein [Clostridium algifaecis]